MRNRTENQITIALIRHGATASNREHRYLGKTDEALDEAGKEELLRLKSEGKYPKADLLFVSPMKRCKETAALIYPGMPYIEIPLWEEMDFGEFERKNYKELSGDARYQAWIDSNGTLPFPGGGKQGAIYRTVRAGFLSDERAVGSKRQSAGYHRLCRSWRYHHGPSQSFPWR